MASNVLHFHRRSQGVHWVHVHRQGGEKNLGAKFTGESCKCIPRQRVHPPEAEQESIFRKLGEVI